MQRSIYEIKLTLLCEAITYFRLYLPSAAKRQLRTGNVFGFILDFEFLIGCGGCLTEVPGAN